MSDEERDESSVRPRETLYNGAINRKELDNDTESMPQTENSEEVASELYTNTMMSLQSEDADHTEMTVQQKNYLMHIAHED